MKPVSHQKDTADLEKVVTLGVLLEYTDEFLLPKIDEMFKESEQRMDGKLNKLAEKFNMLDKKIDTVTGKLQHDLLVAMDEKFADYTSDIFKRLDKKYKRDKEFKEKVVALFKQHNIGTSEDIAFLQGLVAG